MKPKFYKSKQEQASDIIQSSSNAEIENSTTSDGKLNNADNSQDLISATIKSSKSSFSLSQLAVIGILAITIIATFFLVTRGNDFCFFSICSNFPYQNPPIVYSFWSAAGGLGAFGILALLGASAPIAIMGGLATWFLMQISLH